MFSTTGRQSSAHKSNGVRRLVCRVGPIAVAVLGSSSLLMASIASAAQGPVGLATADSFAVLAGSGITNTGPTTITGDIGTHPTPDETGFGSITQIDGANHVADAVALSAKNSLVTAYNDAAGRTPVTNVPVELGNTTLLPGVYTSPTFGLTGTLTLDAGGDTGAEFIFQAGSTLITATNSRVLLINGADPCHVVWQVGSSATFGTGTSFIGTVMALTSITATTGATFQGRLLARNGAVTLDTNTITRTTCAPASGGGTTTTTPPTTTPPTTTPPTTTPPTTTPPTTPGATDNTGGGTTGSTGTGTGTTGTGTSTGTTGFRLTDTTSTETGTGTGTDTTNTGIDTDTTTTGAPGTPTGTPGVSRPPLPRTGIELAPIAGLGLALLAFGAMTLAAARRAGRAGVTL